MLSLPSPARIPSSATRQVLWAGPQNTSRTLRNLIPATAGDLSNGRTAAAGNQQQLEPLLPILATSNMTAKRLATRLCKRGLRLAKSFICPSSAPADHLVQVDAGVELNNSVAVARVEILVFGLRCSKILSASLCQNGFNTYQRTL